MTALAGMSTGHRAGVRRTSQAGKHTRNGGNPEDAVVSPSSITSSAQSSLTPRPVGPPARVRVGAAARRRSRSHTCAPLPDSPEIGRVSSKTTVATPTRTRYLCLGSTLVRGDRTMRCPLPPTGMIPPRVAARRPAWMHDSTRPRGRVTHAHRAATLVKRWEPNALLDATAAGRSCDARGRLPRSGRLPVGPPRNGARQQDSAPGAHSN